MTLDKKIIKYANAANSHIDWKEVDIACVDISLNNRYLEGSYLSGLLQWISNRFEKCHINLGDTLHRHNLKYEFGNEGKAHDISRAMGDKWCRDNAPCFDYLTIPYCLIRGDDWLADPDYDEMHDALWDYYYHDEAFRNVLELDITGFVERNPHLPEKDVRKGSLHYLIEETATDIILGRRGHVVHFYPSFHPACYYYLIQNADKLPEHLKGMEYNIFKRYSPSKLNLKQAKAA